MLGRRKIPFSKCTFNAMYAILYCPLVCIVLIYWQVINQNHSAQRRMESFLVSSTGAGIKHFKNFENLEKHFYSFIQ